MVLGCNHRNMLGAGPMAAVISGQLTVKSRCVMRVFVAKSSFRLEPPLKGGSTTSRRCPRWLSQFSVWRAT